MLLGRTGLALGPITRLKVPEISLVIPTSRYSLGNGNRSRKISVSTGLGTTRALTSGALTSGAWYAEEYAYEHCPAMARQTSRANQPGRTARLNHYLLKNAVKPPPLHNLTQRPNRIQKARAAIID